MKGGLGQMPMTLWVIVAAVVLYLYLRRAALAAPTVTVGGKPAVTIGKGLPDLLRFAQANSLRATENETGQYILTPQPGWQLDIPGLAGTARQQGFNASAAGSQLYVSLPYQGAQ